MAGSVYKFLTVLYIQVWKKSVFFWTRDWSAPRWLSSASLVPSVSLRPISAAAAVTRGHGSVISQFYLVREVVCLHLRLLWREQSLVSELRSCNWTCKTARTCLRALRAIVWKAWSTLMASFALVSKYGILLLLWHHAWARFVVTCIRRSIGQYSKLIYSNRACPLF